MKLGQKILALSVVGTAATSLFVVGVVWLRHEMVYDIALQDVDTKSRDECVRIASQLHNTMEIAHEAELSHVRSGLALALDSTKQLGVKFSEETSTWKAVNQLDKSQKDVTLPKMLLGETALVQDVDPNLPAPVVDEVSLPTEGRSSVFQRMNDAGDMLRVCTSVRSADGKRALGTYIPATDLEGKPNPVIAALLKGERYLDRAFVLDGFYNTGYEPIFDADKNVIGAVAYARRQESTDFVRKHILEATIGKTGYVYVLQGKGANRGAYIVSAGGKRDGENIYEAKDANGDLFIQKAINTALAVEPGKAQIVEYPWKNDGEATAREKIAAMTYFEPWDWVIGVSAYKDDFRDAANAIMVALDEMMNGCMISGVVVSLVLAGVSVFVAKRITRPLIAVSHSLEEIANGDGDLTRRLQINSKDEIGELSHWFNVFIEKLQGIMGRVAGTANQLGTVSTDMFETSSKLAQGAQDTTAKSASVAAAAEEVCTTMDGMTRTSKQMAENVNSAAAAVEEMTSSITDIAKNAEAAAGVAEQAAGLVQTSNDTISRLSEAANGIGKVIEVIEDIAEETGLLALNATIEAARAGESGKGFAVVATEVKELARQTREATEDIRSRIEGIQASSNETVSAIGNIRQTIEQVKSVSRTIAAAVHEQSIATQEIAQNITKTSDAASSFSQGLSGSSDASKEIARNIASVDQEARVSLASANHAKETGDSLAGLATQLQDLVGKFKA